MSNAAQAYARTSHTTSSPREIEAQALLKAARQLQEVQSNWDGPGKAMENALLFNRRLWSIFMSAAQTVRSNLVNQYNGILAQITTTSQDASFNGVNLLGGDQLKLTFNETGKSTLSITGVTFNAAGLGLANLTSGTDFIDNAATNKVVGGLSAASTLLRTQALHQEGCVAPWEESSTSSTAPGQSSDKALRAERHRRLAHVRNALAVSDPHARGAMSE